MCRSVKAGSRHSSTGRSSNYAVSPTCAAYRHAGAAVPRLLLQRVADELDAAQSEAEAQLLRARERHRRFLASSRCSFFCKMLSCKLLLHRRCRMRYCSWISTRLVQGYCLRRAEFSVRCCGTNWAARTKRYATIVCVTSCVSSWSRRWRQFSRPPPLPDHQQLLHRLHPYYDERLAHYKLGVHSRPAPATLGSEWEQHSAWSPP